jgi:hypothetical protein
MDKFKKIIVASVMFSLMAAPVFGTTAEDLATQIAALQEQLNQLMAQYQTLTGTPATGVACTFTRNLYPGVTGEDVKCLQEYLNATEHPVATTGPGSPGNETMYYGSLTQAAVKAWQDANSVPYGAYGGYFGPVSRAKFAETATTPVTPGDDDDDEDEEEEPAGPATEGTLSVTAAATPADAKNVYVGEEKVAIAGLQAKALGSDIKLSRLDINFTTRPWLNVSEIAVSDGTKEVVYNVTEAGTTEVVAGSSYDVRITDLDMTVPMGTTKTLTVKVTPKLVAGDDTETITYQIAANAVRGTDGIGLTQYSPSTALTARTFVIGTASGALALGTNADNPVERAVIGAESAVTEGVELLRFDLKATVNDVIVSKIKTQAITDTDEVLQTLELYDGDTLLAATSVVSGQVHHFNPVNLTVAKDTTKTLSIKATLNKVTASVLDGSTSVSVDTTDITAQDSDSFATVTLSGSTATGKTIHVYTGAPILALVSTSIATTRDGLNDASNTVSALGKIKFNVTALTEDVYFGSTAGSGITPAVNTPTSTSIASDYASNATVESSTWLVRQGETKWFEVTSLISNTTTDAYFTHVNLTNVKWGPTAASSTEYTWAWTDIPLEYRTSSVYLDSKN